MFPMAGRIQVPLCQHPAARQRVGQPDVQRAAEPGDEAELRAVHEAPHQRRDHGRHRVRQEDCEPVERRPPQSRAVQRQRRQQREDEHDRDLQDEEERDPAHRRPELRGGQRLPVPDKLAAALLSQARVLVPERDRAPLFAAPAAVCGQGSPSDQLTAYLGRAGDCGEKAVK